jgi:hypothetical protein
MAEHLLHRYHGMGPILPFSFFHDYIALVTLQQSLEHGQLSLRVRQTTVPNERYKRDVIQQQRPLRGEWDRHARLVCS